MMGSYEKRGHIDTYTGFRLQGVMARNKAINYPIQGDAFHCLLWSLIQLQKTAVEEKWDSKWIGQIHDSMVGDIVPEEKKHIFKTAQQIMCKDIRKHWPWIIVPLEIEIEVAPIDRPWNEKEKIKLKEAA